MPKSINYGLFLSLKKVVVHPSLKITYESVLMTQTHIDVDKTIEIRIN